MANEQQNDIEQLKAKVQNLQHEIEDLTYRMNKKIGRNSKAITSTADSINAKNVWLCFLQSTLLGSQ